MDMGLVISYPFPPPTSSVSKRMALPLDSVGKCNNTDCTASCGDFFCENLARHFEG
jgi:hypothetical protein